MDISLTIDGHFNLTWEKWIHVVAMAERLGFKSLFRSDHYFYDVPGHSLDAFLTFAVGARETQRIRLGPLVTPVTFRRPVDVGRMAAQLDVLSEGRFVLGLGAGWYEKEHRAYGLKFPNSDERFDRLEDAIQLMRALWGPGPTTYLGRYHSVTDVDCLPKPLNHLPILIGGEGERRALPMIAKHADEWNCINLTPEQYARKKELLNHHCANVKRDPSEIRHTMMVFGLIGNNRESIDRVTRSIMKLPGMNPRTSLEEYREEAREKGRIVGSTDQVIDQLGNLAEAGIQEVIFQHSEVGEDDLPEYLSSEIIPRVSEL